MRQDDGIDLSRGNRELRPIAQPQVLESLEQAAIHEHTLPAVLEQILRPGHRAGSTHKRQVSHRTTISGLQASGPGASEQGQGASGGLISRGLAVGAIRQGRHRGRWRKFDDIVTTRS